MNSTGIKRLQVTIDVIDRDDPGLFFSDKVSSRENYVLKTENVISDNMYNRFVALDHRFWGDMVRGDLFWLYQKLAQPILSL